jgi:hypothetical protein
MADRMLSIVRTACVIAVVASLACSSGSLAPRDGGLGGRDSSVARDAGRSGDAFATGDAREDTRVTGDSATGALPPPPLNLPGVVLWLDADVGIAASGSAAMTWTDRSTFRHVFMGQAAGDDMPAMTQLNGHGAVRFNGRNRFISEQTPTPAQQDALSLGSNFVVALVFVPEREVPEGAILTAAMLPWLSSPPPANVVAPHSAPAFWVTADTGPTRRFEAGGSELDVGGGFAQSPQRLILSTEGGNQVRVRLNGQLQTGTPVASDHPGYDGAYAPIYVGSWDFDIPGLEGTVAEMVIIRGGADLATEEALDSYLMRKFSL